MYVQVLGSPGSRRLVVQWVHVAERRRLFEIRHELLDIVDTLRVDRVRLGSITGMDATTSGIYYFDTFESRRQTYIGP